MSAGGVILHGGIVRQKNLIRSAAAVIIAVGLFVVTGGGGGASDINIAGSVHGNGCGAVFIIARAAVARRPELAAAGRVFYGCVVTCGAARDIDIAGAVQRHGGE